MTKATIYLIPVALHDDPAAIQAIPAYITTTLQKCNVFFAENERTARRFFKQLWKEMVIDDYTWYTIHKAEAQVQQQLKQHIAAGDTIGIVSEAGCPGIADPGQVLVHVAQQMQAKVVPLVGPSSILLALMASGMNGQKFAFHGYLPIDGSERKKTLQQLENDSAKNNCTQLFIETPYRNNQLVKDVLQACRNTTLFCIAAELTAAAEQVQTKTITQWKQQPAPDIHKKPVIFLLYAGN
jgi:16S rRNA (cytidine1402-2'-O)-methyltransferase